MMSHPTEEFMSFHQHGIAFLWCIAVDVAIYFALFPYKKYSFYVHAILGSLILAFSLGWIFPLIIPLGLYMGFGQRGVAASVKAWFGVLFIACSGLLIIFGYISRVMQQKEKSKSRSIKILKKVHSVIGYFTILISKASVLIGYWRTNLLLFWICLGWQIFTLVLFIIRKYYFFTLQQTIIDQQTINISSSIPLISSKQLDENKLLSFVIFSGHVYNIEKLKTLHPIGYEIVNKVSGREIDRFIYGMYSAELLPQISAHSHSWKSMEIVGKPIAKLNIPNPYQNMPQLFEVDIQYLESTESNDIYILGLKPKDQCISLSFKGYSDIDQLGQYHSLTINAKTTRLYTFVNFLQISNKQLLMRLIDNPEVINFNESLKNQSTVKIQTSIKTQSAKQSLQTFQQIQNGCVPLLIKKYSSGKLTSQLLSQQWKGKIQLSSPKGRGLHFGSIEPGKIIIIAGGTGIYPFLDLIDLLFKQHLINQNHPLSEIILNLNPILRSNPFNNYSFDLMAAFRSPEDIPFISLYQIAQLCKQTSTFKAVFKVNQRQQQIATRHPQINFIKEKFDSLLLEAVKNDYRKIWICGPPSMNTSTAQLLLKNGIKQQNFILI